MIRANRFARIALRIARATKMLYLAARHLAQAKAVVGEGYGGKGEFDDGAALEAPENACTASHGWIHLLCVKALQRRGAASPL